MKRISIVGYYGSGCAKPTGQMIKVRTLYDALAEHAQDIKLSIVDTQYLRKNPLLLIWQLLRCLFTTDIIILFAAQNGRRYMFPFFYYMQKVFNYKIYHDCIGGALDTEIGKHANWLKYLNSFNGNWMESPQQISKLEELGITNAKYIPNFKNLKAISKKEALSILYQKPYRFCMFCRVQEMKGIEDALKAIRYVNEHIPGSATLDIYGLIETGEEEWFDRMKKEYKNEFRYCGVAGFNESVQVLSSYLTMLFPTRYRTEGMPGTIVDAMFAGLPVIARRWNWCDNMLTNGYNAFVYDFDKPEAINNILLNVCNNPQLAVDMKTNCLREADKYSVELNIKQIINELRKE